MIEVSHKPLGEDKMPIPSDAIEWPEVVWASPDDTLQTVRDRLQAPEIDNKWRAFVVVRSDRGLYAAASVLEIRPIVWDLGPAALTRRLREFSLFRLQPGIDQDTVDLAQAKQVAGRYLGWQVVLQSGQYAGLFRSNGPQPGLALQPSDSFDLFDDLLPDDALAANAFVAATLEMTVSQIAAALKHMHDPESTRLVIRMDDGSFRVIASRILDEQVQQADGDLWAMPLRAFVSDLWGTQAEARERGDVGHRQAQALAERHGYLVLTQEDWPVGLMTSSVVLRDVNHAELPPWTPSVYNLFNVPEELLRDYPGLEPVARYVNLWFEDADRRVLDRALPLTAGEPYHLAMDVGRLLEHSLIDWERSPAGPQAIIEPREEAFLYVSLFSEDFDISEPTQSLHLTEKDGTEPVRFPLVPLRHSGGSGPSTLEVCLYYRTYLVQTFEVRAVVVAAGETAHSATPQVAELTHARSTSFPEMEELAPREVSLTITRDSPDRYRFTFLVDPASANQEEVARAVELSCQVRLTRDDLTHLITKARRQLYNVVQAFDLLQDPETRIHRKATRALAQVGRQLYLKLFESSSAHALREWMETSLPEGSTIQIVDLAGDFVFPWSLVYTARPWNGDEVVDVANFWGWKYKLVILTDTMLDTYRQACPGESCANNDPTTIATDQPLRVSVGLHERLLGTAHQRAFFANLTTRTGGKVRPEILTDRRSMTKALAAADRDVYYFFCHGYTERIATDIQLDSDLLDHFARLAANAPSDDAVSIREHLDDLFDVSDSWMRLTRGKIPLAMLKETVPGSFARHPIVFLNMCESAQVLPSLSDGFVPFFIQRGARAVVGTECPMNTIFADGFARAFLTRFLQGHSAGDILLVMRRRYLADGNPLALAYTLYADADLRLGEPLLPPGPSPSTQHVDCISEEQARLDAVQSLWADDMDGLLLTLAARAQAEAAGVAQAELQMWDPPEHAFASDVEAGPEWTEKMLAFGQHWWEKLEPKLYAVVCNRMSEDHYLLMNALKDGIQILAVALAPALVTQMQALPAVAIVLATIAAKQIADAGLEAVCDSWEESLSNDEQAPDPLEGITLTESR
jgi:hypothetical protein